MKDGQKKQKHEDKANLRSGKQRKKEKKNGE